MEVKVCRGCKKLFQYVVGPTICPACKQLEEKMFQKVKEYLVENQGANMHEVSRATGVSVRTIEGFLRQGRLEVSPNSPIAMGCERCGKKIATGRYCNICQNNLISELNEVKKGMTVKKEADDVQAKMRFLNGE